MDIEILRGEIERLLSLDELTALSRELLGLDPDEIGGTSAKASSPPRPNMNGSPPLSRKTRDPRRAKATNRREI